MPKFNFRCVSTEEIKAIISCMPSNKSPGHDKIHMRVIKTCLPHIIQVITDLVNTSLMTGHFPRDLKLAEVVAHLKEGDHEVVKNNRPIYLLPVLSKVLERVAHEQSSHFRASNNMLRSIRVEIKDCIPRRPLEYCSPTIYIKLLMKQKLQLCWWLTLVRLLTVFIIRCSFPNFASSV